MLGVILAIAAALAIWLAFGNQTLMWRTIWATLGASVVALEFCATSGELESEWLGLVWVVLVTIAAIFAFARWLGFRLMDTTHGGRIRPEEMQFSVAQLMTLTAVIASIAAVARMLAPLVATINALMFGIAIALCLGVLALVAVWATLRSEISRVRLSTLVVVAIAAAGLVYYAMEMTNADPGLVWGSVVIVYTTALAGLLLFARSQGIRLQRNSECGEPTARPAIQPGRADILPPSKSRGVWRQQSRESYKSP